MLCVYAFANCWQQKYRHVSQPIAMTSSAPITFPHHALSAAKTAKAGVVTVNDIISEDMYSIMTRESANDVVTHIASCYSLDNDTSSLLESARNETIVGSNGSAKITTSLLQTNNGVRVMNDVITTSNDQTSISNFDPAGTTNTARFTTDGLRWDQSTSSIYVGGSTFRIRYEPPDALNNNVASLNFEARNPQLGGYVAKLQITND